jgi:hypothetical protein
LTDGTCVSFSNRATGVVSCNELLAGWERNSRRSLRYELSIPHSSLDLDEPDTLVSTVGELVVKQGVRSELAKALGAGPGLSCVDQRATDPLATRIGINIPALEKRNWAGRAAIGVRPRADLGKTAQPTGLTHANDHSCIRSIDPLSHLKLMLLMDVTWPQRTSHPKPFRPISIN